MFVLVTQVELGELTELLINVNRSLHLDTINNIRVEMMPALACFLMGQNFP